MLSPSATTTVRAGTGIPGFSGDGGRADAARLASAMSMAQDAQGNLYIADTRNHRVRRVSASSTISTVAGTGTQGFAGDGGPAAQAQLDSPSGVAVSTDGTIYIADTRNHRIRQVDGTGTIRTLAGTGGAGFSGDGGLAVAALLSSPQGLSPGLTGDLYLADTGNQRVRRISSSGTITTVAGDGGQGSSADGAQATAAHLDSPSAVVVRSDGSLLITDRRNDRVVVVLPDGTLQSLIVASLPLRRPRGVAVNSRGDMLIADSGNYRIAQVSTSGAGTVLGSGEQGAPNSSVAPVLTAMGAPAAVISGNAGAATEFSAMDQDHSQVFRITVPQIGFSDTPVATTSTVRTLALKNAGAAILAISAIGLPEAFSLAGSSSCGASPFRLPGGQSCNLDLLFTPVAEGLSSGLLQVSVQGAAAQRVALSGNGVRTGTMVASSTTLQASGSISYAGSALSLTAQVLGSTSAVPSGSVVFLDGTSELGRSTLDVTSAATLSTAALQTGAHTLSARYSGNPLYLSSISAAMGVTVVPAPDFTMSAPGASRISVQSGNAGAMAVLLQPMQGVLNQNVTVTVSGLPIASTVNITPVPVLLASDPVTVNIAFKLPVNLVQRHSAVAYTALLLFGLLFFPRRKLQSLLLVCGLIATRGLQGCGGGYLGGASVTSQSSATTYPVTVTASCKGVTGATITHTAAFTVVVQP